MPKPPELLSELTGKRIAEGLEKIAASNAKAEAHQKKLESEARKAKLKADAEKAKQEAEAKKTPEQRNKEALAVRDKKKVDFGEKFHKMEVDHLRKLSITEKLTTFENATTSVGLQQEVQLLKQLLSEAPAPGQWENLSSHLKHLNDIKVDSPIDIEIKKQLRQELANHYYDNYALYNHGRSVNTLFESDYNNLDAVRKVYNDSTQKREQAIQDFRKDKKLLATSDRPQNSEEWATDIAKQILVEDKQPPELGQIPYDHLKAAIGDRYAHENVKWLTDGKMPTTREGAQVLLDILENPDPSKEFLFVKGSQLVHEEQLHMDATKRPELSQMNKNFRDKVGQEYYADKSQSVETVKKVRKELMDVQEEKQQSESVRGKSRFYVDDDTIEALTGGDPEKLKKFKDFLREVNAKLGDKSVEVPFPDRDSRLIYQNNVMDLWDQYNEEFLHDAAFGMNVKGSLLETINPHMKQLIMEGATVMEDMNRRGWSDLYLSPKIMRSLHENAMFVLQEMNDQERANLSLFDNDVSTALSRSRTQMINYVSNPDYKENRRAYLQHKDNAERIRIKSGQRFDLDHPEDHPWYKQINDPAEYDRYRKMLSHLASDAASLKADYSMISSNAGFDKMTSAAANLGDDGILRIINGRGGFNSEVLDAMRRMGATMKFDPTSGEWRVVSGPAFTEAEGALTQEILRLNKAGLYTSFNEWAGRGLTELDVKYAIKEVTMLRVATGDRAIDVREGATPFENRSQTPEFIAQYAGQVPDYAWLQIQDPVNKVFFRWGMDSKATHPVLRRLGFNEAAKQGIDTQVKELMAGKSRAEIEQIARKYFNIHEGAPDQAKAQREGLSQLELIKRGLKGFDISQLPTTLAELKQSDLEDFIKFKEGLSVVALRITGGWTYRDSGWINQTLLSCFRDDDFIAKGQGVGLHEDARLQFGELINATDHDALHAAEHDLKHPAHGESILKQLGKYDAMSVIDALHDKRLHQPTEQFLIDNAAKFNIFQDVGEKEVAITANRYDLLQARVTKRTQLIEQQMANGIKMKDGKIRRFGRVDYSKGADYYFSSTDEIIKQQFQLIDKVCKATGVDTRQYLDMMKTMSDFALRKEIMDALATPLFGRYFMNVHTPDARAKFVDSFDNEKKNFSVKISEKDPSAASAYARLVGDSATVVKGLNSLYEAIDAKDYKTYRDQITNFVKTIQWAGGHGAEAGTIMSMDYAWLGAARRDFWYDMFGVGGDHATVETSEMQRAAGLGRPTMTLNEYDHAMHDGETLAGEKWHEFNHSAAVSAEQEARLIVGPAVRWPKFVRDGVDKWAENGIKKHPQRADFYKRWRGRFHKDLRFSTLWIYRYWAYGLMAGFVFLAGAFDNAKKGASGQGGGGGGGGGGDPHGH